jgi:hypothetical protein
VGHAKFDLIRASGFRKFPPQLPRQPYFYPSQKEEYAVQIARDWNTKDSNSGFVGYVLRFDMLSSYLDTFEVHTVGDSCHREYWIPAADLEEFNRNIVGPIRALAWFKLQAESGEARAFDLGDSGGSDVASNKDAMIGDSFEQARRNR